MKQIKDFINKDLPCFREDTPVSSIIKVFSESSHNILPVVDKEEKVIGLVSLEELLDDLLFSREEVSVLEKVSFLADFLTDVVESVVYMSFLVVARDVMQTEVFSVQQDDSMTKAAIMMKKKGVHRLIVLDEQKRVLGYVSRNEICRVFLLG